VVHWPLTHVVEVEVDVEVELETDALEVVELETAGAFDVLELETAEL
jgi:preprotein translocase subunit SecB